MSFPLYNILEELYEENKRLKLQLSLLIQEDENKKKEKELKKVKKAKKGKKYIMQGTIEENIEENNEGIIEDNIQDNLQSDIQENIQDNIQDDILVDIQDDIPVDIPVDIQDNIQDKMQDIIQDNIQNSIQDNIQDNNQSNIQGDAQNNVQDNIQNNIKGNIHDKPSTDIVKKELSSQTPIESNKINVLNNINNSNVMNTLNNFPEMEDENNMDIDFVVPRGKEDQIKKQKYSINFKYKILEELNNKKPSEIARKYNIPLTTFKGWIKNREKYKNQISMHKGNKERLIGGGRKIIDSQYELFLLEWIKKERLKRNQVSYYRLIKYAKENYKGKNLTFSYGWLRKFLDRNGLSYRKRTSNCFINEDLIKQKIQEKFFPDLYTYLFSNQEKRVFYNMDEMRIELDCNSEKTIDLKGGKYIPFKTSNNERKAYTIALCVSSEGKKLKPYILFDGMGTKLMKTLDPKNAVIAFTKQLNRSYMNAHLFKKWCRKVYDKEVSAEEKKNSILFLDKCGSIHDAYAPTDTKVIFFPAYSTKFLQPLDLGVNKIVKGKFKMFWEEWMSSNNQTTSAGFVKAMDRQTFIDGICKIWEQIDTTTVINSFNVIRNGLKKIDEDLNNHLFE